MPDRPNQYSTGSFIESVLGFALIGAAIAFLYGLFNWPSITLLACGYVVLWLFVFRLPLSKPFKNPSAEFGEMIHLISIAAALGLGGGFGGPDGVSFRTTGTIVLTLTALAVFLLILGEALKKSKGIGLLCVVVFLVLCLYGFPPPSESYEAHHPEEYPNIYQKTEIDVTVVTPSGQGVEGVTLWLWWRKDGKDVSKYFWECKDTDESGKGVCTVWYPQGLTATLSLDSTDKTKPDVFIHEKIELGEIEEGETREVQFVARYG